MTSPIITVPLSDNRPAARAWISPERRQPLSLEGSRTARRVACSAKRDLELARTVHELARRIGQTAGTSLAEMGAGVT